MSLINNKDLLDSLKMRIPSDCQIIRIGDLFAFQLDLLIDSCPDIWHGSFLRINGLSPSPFDSLNTGYRSGDKKRNIEKNMELIKTSLNSKVNNLVILDLCHTTNVEFISQTFRKNQLILSQTDAVISTHKKHCLFISTADCNPIFLIDRANKLISIVHAGWKGLVGKIITKTLNEMINRGAEKKNIIAGIGPSIGPCCYKLKNPKQQELTEWKKYLFSVENGLTAIDLWTAAEYQLIDYGIPKQNIQVSRFCTSCNEDLFFSFWKRKPLTGRFASLIFRNDS